MDPLKLCHFRLAMVVIRPVGVTKRESSKNDCIEYSIHVVGVSQKPMKKLGLNH